MELDLFVSFSGSDRNQIYPIIKELEQRGLNVWWSDYLKEGRWDLQIEEKINSAKRVVAFISPNVDHSQRDYIFEEIERARSQDKLIPVIVEGGSQSFAVRGIIALLQSYFFENFSSIIGTSEFEKLIELCGGKKRKKGIFEKNKENKTSIERVEDWYEKIETNYDTTAQFYLFSVTLTTAIFEFASFTEVELLAQNLYHSLKNLEGEEDALSLSSSNCPSRRTPLLNAVDCTVKSIEHQYLGIEQKIIYFKDPERAASFLMFAWEEFGNRREIFYVWLSDIVAQASADARLRIGFALGTLAQNNFIDIFDQILKKWLLSDKFTHQLTADIALSVAAYHPKIPRIVKKNTISWAKSNNGKQNEAAIRLACGFSGTRIPDLTISTLKIVANNKSNQLTTSIIDTMEKSIKYLLVSHVDETDDSLFDFQSVVEALATWAVDDISINKDDKNIRENPYPLLIFLLVLENIPLAENLKPRGSLSLSSLVHSSKLATLTAQVFNAALERPRINTLHTRKPAEKIIRKWIAQYISSGKSHFQKEPLLLLAKKLISTASSSNDIDRVVYIFDSIFTEDELQLNNIRY